MVALTVAAINMRRAGVGLLMSAGLLTFSPLLLAHSPWSGSLEQRFAGATSALLLLGFWLTYLRGSLRVPTPQNRQIGFHLVAVICAVTMLGPLDDMARHSTAAHMTQHMLIIVVISPLWVLCSPLPQLMAGGLRPTLPWWKPLLRLVRKPMLMAALHAAAIWIWHVPYFYMLAVESAGWHTFEHVCFLITGGLFWWSVLRSSAATLPNAFLALLFTLMHTGFLGAILGFSDVALYDESRNIEDQQLAGLIMWVAGAFPYLAGLCWLNRRWYQRIEL